MHETGIKTRCLPPTRASLIWFCTTGLPSDVIVEVEEMTFHLHKFPLLSKSSFLERLIKNSDEEDIVTRQADVPGGTQAFELVAKF
ncbi:BTB/POZ domain-containing protein At1g30440-like isoform X2 [Zingiber officinale]|uniref:BTB/POZ domain-containing protein At1g30440-like isoform X2 n=1 Tax=Zingiber officinale TaxID=94328 RepID=UPI001C4C365C|nr:BTB/POZ domain-containing protein At1g30440-like isoform X2 [Zingiber officinale]